MNRGRGNKVEICWIHYIVDNLEGKLYEKILIYQTFQVALMLEHFIHAFMGSSELSYLNGSNAIFFFQPSQFDSYFLYYLLR